MDPLTAYAAAQAALSMIRKGVEFYKECKATASDVSEITSEVSGHIGKFLDAKSVVEEAAVAAKKESEESDDVTKINSQALNNVMMQVQLEAAEKELREMLIYQTPGLGAIWTRFSIERERLTKIQREKREKLERQKRLENIEAGKRAQLRKKKLREVWDNAFWVITVITIIIFFCLMMYLIILDRIEQYPELGTCFIPRGSPGFSWWSSLRWINCNV
jgi:hypothetical protein